MTTGAAHKRVEVIVVGGGQSGLAIGYFLGQHKLFTPSRSDALPGLAFPGDPDRYPIRDEVASYLTGYARRLELPVELGSRVRTIRKTASTYMVSWTTVQYEADQVVVATGPFQVHQRLGLLGWVKATRPTVAQRISAFRPTTAADALTSAPAERRVP